MKTQTSLCELKFQDPDDYHRLKDRLTELNYSNEGFDRILGLAGISTPDSIDLPLLLRKTNGGSDLETLIRVFIMGVRVNEDAMLRALAPVSLQNCLEAGLIRSWNGQIYSKLSLMPFQDLVLASDSSDFLSSDIRGNWVMGVGGSTEILANLTPKKSVEKTLDLGCGCGTLALLAAKHSRKVIAVDNNPRALDYTKFNVYLNRRANVNILVGNLFEPVIDQQFDLIVTNPPYVISPSSTFSFRDSELRGDKFCRRLIEESVDYLAEDGNLVMGLNWVHNQDQDSKSDLSNWFDGLGCDVWILRDKIYDISEYATRWLKATEARTPEQNIGPAYEQWMNYYKREGIEAIGCGAMVMRRRSNQGKNWLRIDDSLRKVRGDVGHDILLLFQLQDYLASTSDEALLGTAFQIVPQLRLRQEFKPDDGAWVGRFAELVRVRGMSYSFNVDFHVAGLVAQCDGRSKLEDLLKDLVPRLGENSDVITSKVIPIIRKLVEGGFLVPEGIPRSPSGL